MLGVIANWRTVPGWTLVICRGCRQRKHRTVAVRLDLL
jgi:hypothetical protein